MKKPNVDFTQSSYIPIGLSALEDLGAIKTLVFEDYSGKRTKSIGIYDDFIIYPKELFLKQNVIRLTENLSTKLNAEVRFAVTNDLVNYYVYQNNEFRKIQDIRNGMPIHMLANINFESWQGDMGIAISIQERSIDKEIEVEDLFVSVNKRIQVMGHGRYKINFGTLIDVEKGTINTTNNIDSIFG